VVIQTEGLCKQYGQTTAVRELDLQVRKSEVYGFLGPNGAGKTTTILMVLGMVKPTRGKVFVLGEQVKGLETKLRARIGVVPEHQSLYDEMTAWEYLRFFCHLHQVKDPGKRLSELLEYFELLPFRNVRLGEYSHGMRQKINICRGFLHEPDLLILDEPVLGLDPASVRLVRDMILSEKGKGTTTFISSHMLSEIEKTADRVGIMSEGELVVEGSIEQISATIGGRNVLEVELAEVTPAMEEKLRELEFVIDLQKVSNKLNIQVENPQEARLAVSRRISDLGGTILSFGVRGTGLEDAFLAITKGHIERLKEEIG
jgi:ABC-2 type transport system ATP-binding protein